MNDTTLAPVRTPFRALFRTFVPEASELDERGWADAEAIVERSSPPDPPPCAGSSCC